MVGEVLFSEQKMQLESPSRHTAWAAARLRLACRDPLCSASSLGPRGEAHGPIRAPSPWPLHCHWGFNLINPSSVGPRPAESGVAAGKRTSLW